MVREDLKRFHQARFLCNCTKSKRILRVKIYFFKPSILSHSELASAAHLCYNEAIPFKMGYILKLIHGIWKGRH